jgi:hypothetical protein
MVIWLVRWRDQHKKELNLFSIKTLKIDPGRAYANRSYRLRYTRVFCVWNGNSSTYSSAPQLFSLQDCLDDRFLIISTKLSGFDQAGD